MTTTHIRGRMSRQEALKQGYTVDTHCYPWVAYKGARFAPDDWFTVRTDDEQAGIQDVAEFHRKYEVPVADFASFLPYELWKFRIGFLQEELQEIRDAHAAGDMHGVADGLLDLVYVALGTADLMGLTPVWNDMWNNVQKANMSKVMATSADQSKRGYAKDIIKPDGWKAPDHTLQLGEGPWPTLS